MPASKKTTKNNVAGAKPSTKLDHKVCFVISPIGKEGTELHTRFKEVFEYIIKNAVKASGYELNVLRADDIDQAGSFIKDILENLYSSFVVIADLTGQNPNVFYELGVRHSLRPRTILIAQSVDDIPSDLREYRTIVYDTSAKGAANFAKRLKNYLTQLHKEPERPDNPVLDRIGSIFENQLSQLEAEKQNLQDELSNLQQERASKPEKRVIASVFGRVNRILQLMNAERQVFGGSYHRDKKSYQLPSNQGSFSLYFVEEDNRIKDFLYLSIQPGHFDYNDDLADVRVLMEKCVQQGGVWCKFIIATDADLSSDRENISTVFNKMKEKLSSTLRKNFNLEIWDAQGMLDVEKEIGLKV